MSHPTQPQYGAPHPAPSAPAQPARNGLGTAGLVLGILGVIFAIIPLLFWLGGILALLGLILGAVGMGRAKRGAATNKGVAVAGTVLGLIGLILSIVIGVMTAMAVDKAVDDINKELSKTAPKAPAGGDKGSAAAGDAGGTEGTDGAAVPELLAADEAIVYDDDLQISVSAAKSFEPSEYNVGHTKGNKAYKVTVVIQNGSKAKFNADTVLLEARAGADGVTAEQIYDEGLDGVTGTVAPGQKATGTYAFSVPAGAKTLTVEVTPGFDYEAQQWELKF
jgi:hypothetical protein